MLVENVETCDWFVTGLALCFLVVVLTAGTQVGASIAGFFIMLVGAYLAYRLNVSKDKKARTQINVEHLGSLMFTVCNARNKIEIYKRSAMRDYNPLKPEGSYLGISLEHGPLADIDPVTHGSFGYLLVVDHDGTSGKDVAQLYDQFAEKFLALKRFIDQYNQTKIPAMESLKTQGLGFNAKEIYQFADSLDHTVTYKLIGTAGVLDKSVNELIDLCTRLEEEIVLFGKQKWGIHLERSNLK